MIEMILIVLFIYLMYFFWISFNFDKKGQIKVHGKNKKGKGSKKKMPSEVEYFVAKYNIDLTKVNYRYFLQLMGLVIAVDIGIVVAIVLRFKEFWLQLLIGFVLIIIVVLISFKILAKFFRKKGLIKNV